MMSKKWMVALLAGALLTSTATTASARETDTPEDACQVDADCGEGFVCESHTIGYCEGSSSEGHDMDGGEGHEGGEGNEPDPSCSEDTVKQCSPAPPPTCDPAQNSGDCSHGNVCVSFTFEECSGTDAIIPPCEEGEECPEPAPEEPTCSTQTESYCIPPYLAPCTTDANCGGGFTCVEESVDACASPPPTDHGHSGGTDEGRGDSGEGESSGGDSGEGSEGGGDSSEGSDGDEEGHSSGPDCGEPASGPTSVKYCQLNEVECTTDTDCAAGLECVTIGGDEPTATSTCRVDEDGNEQCDGPTDPPPSVDKKFCAPKNWERWGYATGRDVATAGDGNDTTSIARPEGAADADGGWKLVESSTARPTNGGGGDIDSSPGGCSSTGNGGAPATGLGILGLLGMLGLSRRRKRS